MIVSGRGERKEDNVLVAPVCIVSRTRRGREEKEKNKASHENTPMHYRRGVTVLLSSFQCTTSLHCSEAQEGGSGRGDARWSNSAPPPVRTLVVVPCDAHNKQHSSRVFSPSKKKMRLTHNQSTNIREKKLSDLGCFQDD